MRFAAVASAVLLVAPPAAAQLADLQPGRNFTAEPNFGGSAWSQQADGGDVDLDGDIDVVVANGGEGPNLLPRIYINDSSGTFTDETAQRFAGFLPLAGRDVEFFDAENDGDLDFLIACDRSGGGSVGAVSRFYVNLGGSQRGAVGHYQEATDSTWGSLVSVPLADQVFGGDSGPFRDWSCDCEFGDLDDDGDTDLFFGSYGPHFDASRDSRVFLNDGLGTFNELWPWADVGSDTTWRSFDFDLADCDGDFDFDLVAETFGGASRVFVSNLYGTSLGPLAFHEITQHALIDTGAVGTNPLGYETEFGDADGDGDFDVWMGEYDGNTDRLLRNDGPDAGGFAFTQMDAWIQGNPNTDEEEADFADYDNDGDLDVFVANFSGTNSLYQSNLAQGGMGGGLLHRTGAVLGQAPNPELPSNFNGGTSLDGELFDFDGDGDLDIAMTTQQSNWMFLNVLGVPDTHAPVLQHVTVQADKPNGAESVIHVAVRDNAPLQLHRYYEAMLVYSVDGGAAQSTAMFAQGGPQYRGIIPAQTDATVEYHVEITDLAGNSGVSATLGFDQGIPDAWIDLGSGLAGAAGIPVLAGTGLLTAGSAGALTLSSAAPSAICALFVSIAGTSAPFKCGTLVPVPVAIQLTLVTNGAGGLPLAWGSWPSGLSGASLYFQYAIADGAAVCGTALSNALRADVP